MANQPLSTSTRRHPQGLILSLLGRLDADSVEQCRQTVDQAVNNRPQSLFFDLSGLTYASSAGLRLFLLTAKRLRETGNELVLLSPHPNVRSVLEVSGFHKILTIREDPQKV